MGTIRIKNLSSLTDGAAVGRVSLWIKGLVDTACCDANKQRIINIHKRDNTYTVTDAEEQKSAIPGSPDTAQE